MKVREYERQIKNLKASLREYKGRHEADKFIISNLTAALKKANALVLRVAKGDSRAVTKLKKSQAINRRRIRELEKSEVAHRKAIEILENTEAADVLRQADAAAAVTYVSAEPIPWRKWSERCLRALAYPALVGSSIPADCPKCSRRPLVKHAGYIRCDKCQWKLHTK